MSESSAHARSHTNYVKVYAVLLVLFGISLLGPRLGIAVVTVLTVFGLAIVKATMVAAYFMHLNVEKRYVWYVLLTMVAFLMVLFAGVAPDVMKDGGKNWRHIAPVAAPSAAHAE